MATEPFGTDWNALGDELLKGTPGWQSVAPRPSQGALQPAVDLSPSQDAIGTDWNALGDQLLGGAPPSSTPVPAERVESVHEPAAGLNSAPGGTDWNALGDSLLAGQGALAQPQPMPAPAQKSGLYEGVLRPFAGRVVSTLMNPIGTQIDIADDMTGGHAKPFIHGVGEVVGAPFKGLGALAQTGIEAIAGTPDEKSQVRLDPNSLLGLQAPSLEQIFTREHLQRPGALLGEAISAGEGGDYFGAAKKALQAAIPLRPLGGDVPEKLAPEQDVAVPRPLQVAEAVAKPLVELGVGLPVAGGVFKGVGAISPLLERAMEIGFSAEMLMAGEEGKKQAYDLAAQHGIFDPRTVDAMMSAVSSAAFGALGLTRARAPLGERYVRPTPNRMGSEEVAAERSFLKPNVQAYNAANVIGWAADARRASGLREAADAAVAGDQPAPAVAAPEPPAAVAPVPVAAPEPPAAVAPVPVAAPLRPEPTGFTAAAPEPGLRAPVPNEAQGEATPQGLAGVQPQAAHGPPDIDQRTVVADQGAGKIDGLEETLADPYNVGEAVMAPARKLAPLTRALTSLTKWIGNVVGGNQSFAGLSTDADFTGVTLRDRIRLSLPTIYDRAVARASRPVFVRGADGRRTKVTLEPGTPQHDARVQREIARSIVQTLAHETVHGTIERIIKNNPRLAAEISKAAEKVRLQGREDPDFAHQLASIDAGHGEQFIAAHRRIYSTLGKSVATLRANVEKAVASGKSEVAIREMREAVDGAWRDAQHGPYEPRPDRAGAEAGGPDGGVLLAKRRGERETEERRPGLEPDAPRGVARGGEAGRNGPAEAVPVRAGQRAGVPGEGAPVRGDRPEGQFSRRREDRPADRPEVPLGVEPERRQPAQDVERASQEYIKSRGIPEPPPFREGHGEDRAMEFADWFDTAKHDPQDPKVQAAYGAAKPEIKDQWHFLHDQGYDIEPWTKEGQPYKNSAEMSKDVRENKHIYFYKGGDIPADHPLAEVDPETGLSYNDMLRGVHDVFGHAERGYQFGPHGEEWAYRRHLNMFTPEARPAIASETRMQNSWVNFGKHMRDETGTVPLKGQPGYVRPEDRPYSEQKAVPAPEEFLYSRRRFDDRPSPEDILKNRWEDLLEPERDKLSRKSAATVVEHLSDMASIKNLGNVSLAGGAKRGWYRKSVQAIASTFGDDAPRFAGVLASTSPMTGVEDNLWAALRVWRDWDKAGRPQDLRSVSRIVKRVRNFKAWTDNAIGALMSDDPANYTLSGPKVDSFFHNLRGDVNQVTNDGWQAVLLGVDETIFSGSGRNVKTEDPGKGPGYLAANAQTRAVAKYLTKLTGETWTPDEVQETGWSWTKTAYEMAYGKGSKKGTTVLDLVRSGKITDAKIGATPAFGDLFREGRYADILKEIGIGGAADRDLQPAGEARDTAGAAGEAEAPRRHPAPDAREIERAARRLDKLARERRAASKEAAAEEEAPAEDAQFSRRRTDAAPAQAREDALPADSPERDENFKKWFGESKVTTPGGEPLQVYHGAQRPDRIGDRFRKDRATSGPMPFFTGDPAIASNYAKGKADTSIDIPDDYGAWFKFGPKGSRSEVAIDQAWWRLSPEQRAEIAEKLPHVSYENPDTASGPLTLHGNDQYGLSGKDHWDYEIGQARGNVLKAAKEIWLNSGELVNGGEESFMDILKLGGMDMSRTRFDDPFAEHSGVLPVFLSIKNPLDAANITEAEKAQLRVAANRVRSKPEKYGADQWDKRTQHPHEWIQRLDDGDGSHAWTSIPDWVTRELRRMGYDGIKDSGGKMGGQKHAVWVPFDETQIKSATGNRGTFDPENPDIRYSKRREDEKPAPTFYSQLSRVAEKLPQAMSGRDMMRYLTDPKRSPGVRILDEAKWTGLDDFLTKNSDRKITPAEVQQYLRENEVKVEEVTLGSKTQNWEVFDNKTGDIVARHPTEAAAKADVAERGTGFDYDTSEVGPSGTKFSQHQTPGGESYRELLLTLPRRGGEAMRGLGTELQAAEKRFREAVNDFVSERDEGSPEAVRSALAKKDETQTALNEVSERFEAARGPSFTAGHYDEPNVLAHVRFNERTDADGKRVLFVEEFQSDWAQKGRREGFAGSRPKLSDYEYAKLEAEHDALRDVPRGQRTPEQQARYAELQHLTSINAGSTGVPSAPFVTDTKAWSELAMKRMVRYAAENGFDRIAWTTGEMQAARYDLSQHLERVRAYRAKGHPDEFQLQGYPKDSSKVTLLSVPDNKLADHVGKDLADKIIAGDGGDFTGLDLKVGGEGMKGFYDQIIPQVANKLGKKFGAQVGKTRIDTGNDMLAKQTYSGPTLTMDEVAAKTRYLEDARLKEQGRSVLSAMQRGTSFEDAMGDQSHALAEAFKGNLTDLPRLGADVHSLDITPQMKQPMPLFSRRRRSTGPTNPRGPGGTGSFQIAGETKVEWAKAYFQDQMTRLKKVEKSVVEQGGRISLSPAQVAARKGGLVAAGVKRVLREVGEPVVAGLNREKASVDDLNLYMQATDAPHRNRVLLDTRGVRDGSGMTDAAAATILGAMRASGLDARLEPIAQMVHDASNAQLDLAVSGELIKQEQADALRAKWGDTYIPWRSEEIDEHQSGGNMRGGGIGVQGRETKMAHGRRTKAFSPVANVLEQYERTIARVERNKIDLALKKVIEDNPDKTLWGIDVEHKAMDGTRDDAAYAEDIAYKESGERHRITIYDKPLNDALRGIDAENLPGVLKIVGDGTRLFSRLVTTWSPPFAFTNLVRDIQDMAINMGVEHGPKLAARAAKGVPFAVRAMYRVSKDHAATGSWETFAREFSEHGGPLGWASTHTARETQAGLVRGVNAQGPGLKKLITRSAGDVGRWVEDANGAVENGTRLSVYRTLRESGVPVHKAVLAAKNMTINFETHGRGGPLANSLYAFFNANIQGAKRLKEVVIDNPTGRKVALGLMAAAAVLDARNRAASSDDNKDGTNDYDDIPEYVKARNFILMRGVGEMPLMIPMPYGFGVIFNAGRLAHAVSRGAMRPAKAAASLASVSINAFNPLGGDILSEQGFSAPGITQAMSPTMLDPFVQHATNKDWRGQDIKPEPAPGSVPKPTSERYWKNVSPTARFLAEKLNSATGGDKVSEGVISWSPEVMKHYWDFATGGLGRFAGNLVDMGASAAKGELPDLRNVPVANRFAYQPSPGLQGSKYRESMAEFELVMAQAKAYSIAGERAKLSALPKAMLKIAPKVKAIDAAVGKVRKLPDGEVKENALQGLYIQANRIFAEAQR